MRQESGRLHIFHKSFHLAELRIGRKRTNPVQPCLGVPTQQQAFRTYERRVTENPEFLAQQIGVQVDCDRYFQIIMRPESTCEKERAKLCGTDIHTFQKRRDHRMRRCLTGRIFPNIILCEPERHITVIGVDNGQDAALPRIIPDLPDTERGRGLQLPRQIDSAGAKTFCDQIKNAGAADSLRRQIADRLISQPVILPDLNCVYRA